jgi:hypothetical protein
MQRGGSIFSGYGSQRFSPSLAQLGQHQGEPFPDDIRHASGGGYPCLFCRLILPLLQLNLRFYHPIIMAYFAIMSTCRPPSSALCPPPYVFRPPFSAPRLLTSHPQNPVFLNLHLNLNLSVLNLPRLNRLTPILWWRHIIPRDDSDPTRERQNQEISRRLRSPEPCAIGKIGTSELLMLEYRERYIRLPWPPAASWWRATQRLHNTGGLYPIRRDIFERFCQEYELCLKKMDILAQWQRGDFYEGVLEQSVLRRFAPQAFWGGLLNLVVFLNPPQSWLSDLAILRWLVVHPFKISIRAQLPHLSALGTFPDSCASALRQRAADTRFLPPPQFSYMVPPRHRDWFHALEEMKQEMDLQKDHFDIALIGAGAWSLPLAAHAKAIGKKALHLGGSLQLLFGIKGGRFEKWGLYNDRWIRPLPQDCPADFTRMEKGAYW